MNSETTYSFKKYSSVWPGLLTYIVIVSQAYRLFDVSKHALWAIALSAIVLSMPLFFLALSKQVTISGASKTLSIRTFLLGVPVSTRVIDVSKFLHIQSRTELVMAWGDVIVELSGLHFSTLKIAIFKNGYNKLSEVSAFRQEIASLLSIEDRGHINGKGQPQIASDS